jgi:PleD family two-component response regulator
MTPQSKPPTKNKAAETAVDAMHSPEWEKTQMLHKFDAIELMVHLGLANPTDLPQNEVVEQYKRQREKRHKALLISDDLLTLRLMSEILREDFRPFFANDPQQALKQISQNPDIKIVFIDLLLPGTNGMLLLKSFRTQRILEGVPVFIMTAKISREIVKTLSALQVTGVIVKRVNKEKVYEVLRKNVPMLLSSRPALNPGP